MTSLSAMAAVVLLGLAAAPLRAQQRTAPAAGDRVRISLQGASPGTLRGELVEVRGDTLVIVRDSTLRRVHVPLSEVERVQVRIRRSPWEGLQRGLLVGVPIGFGGGYLYGWVLEGGFGCRYECGLAPAILSVGGAGLGTLLGTIFGVAMPGGKWVTLPTAAPAPMGAVALSVRIEL
jgi:hypothetical protein